MDDKQFTEEEYNNLAIQALSDVTFPGIDRTPAENERLMRLGRKRLAEIQKEKLRDHQE